MKSRRSAFNALNFCILAAVLLHQGMGLARGAIPNLDEPGRILWTNGTRGAVSSPALASDGLTLYVSSADRRLYAFDAITSDSKWTNRFPGLISAPVIDENGLIYVGCADGRLYGISDQGDFGRIDLRSEPLGRPLSAVALGDDGTIYVGTTGNRLYALFPDGARKWFYVAPDDVRTPVITDDGTILIVAGGFLRGVSSAGVEESSFTPGAAIRSLPALGDDGTIYFGANDRHVYALNSGATTSDIRWRFFTGKDVISSPAVGADGRVYIASDNSRLYCFTTNGAVRWSVATRAPVHAPLSIGVDGTIYAGCDDKRLYAISSEGKILWTIKTRAPVRSSPAIDAFGVVYFGSGRTVYAVQTDAQGDDTEELAWQMFRKDAQHTARATECRPFLVREPFREGDADELDFAEVSVGEEVRISVDVRAGAPLSFQWRLNGVDIDSVGNRTATNATFVISSASATNAGEYTVHAFNDCDTDGVESEIFTLSISNAPPMITSDITNQFLLAGNTLTLHVTAVGTPPLSYQWYFNSNAIDSATNATATSATFSITNAQPSDSGVYYVAVSNLSGAVESFHAVITVFSNALTLADHPLGAGQRHSLAVLSNHTLWAWGLNNFGQLGDNNTSASATTFTNVPKLIGTNGSTTTNAVWVNISGGSRGYDPATNQPGGFSIGIQTNGTLWSWGLNDHGQLGINSTNLQRAPFQVGTDTNWVQAEAGAAHTIALKRDGTMWTWGANDAGQLGIGSTNRNSLVPVRVGDDSAWVEVRAGGHFSLARRADGTIWAWGTNGHGQLGIGTNTARVRSPMMVGTNSDWTGISASVFHSLGLKTNGTIWSWGRNNFGQLGLGIGMGNGNEGSLTNNRPAQIGTNSNWAMIEAGNFHSFAIDTGGKLFGWGANFFGQIGDGTIGSAGFTNDMNRVSPVPVAGTNIWRSIDASSHSLGMTIDGNVWSWGLNNNGQVGDGTGGDGSNANNRAAPVLLVFTGPTNIVSTNPPSITAQPTSQTVLQGDNAAFTVVAKGAEPLAYQWYFNSVPISSVTNNSATNFSLLITNAQAGNVGPYFVVVTNQFGKATSSMAMLTVTNSSGMVLGPTNAPGFIRQPVDVLANEGTNVSFSVTATGTATIVYQWYFFSNIIAAAENSSATQMMLTLTNVQGSNAGYYHVVATNNFGSATSVFAALTVTNTNGIVFFPNGTNYAISNSPPFITQQPTNSSVNTNNVGRLTVAADGAMPLFYQWRANSNVIDSASNTSATSATLTVTNTSTASTNFYDVIVSNSLGSVTSVVATLVVTALPCPPPGTCDERPEPEIRLGTVTVTDTGVTVPVSVIPARGKLVLEYKDALADPDWKPLSTNDSSALKLIDPKPPLGRARYYRVRAE